MGWQPVSVPPACNNVQGVSQGFLPEHEYGDRVFKIDDGCRKPYPNRLQRADFRAMDDSTPWSILMIGIRFHGRGGQGAVLASKILASAYFAQGFYVQSFPFFGMERKGAAVAAFVRVATRPIVERGEILNPSIVVVLDSTLLQMVDVTKGVGPGGVILLDYLARDDRRPLEGPFRIAAVDARNIALEYGLGTKIAPIVNTVILGAFAKIADNLNLEHLITAIEASVPINPEQNAAAAHASYKAVHWIQGQAAASLESPVQPKTAIQCFAELPTLPETRGIIDWNQTGTWRYLAPVAANKLPPCRSNCPSSMPIPEIIQAVSHGHNLKALELVFSVNPLPGLTGNLCYHPCQIDCLRRKIDRPVAIQHLERFIAAQDFSPSIANPPNESALVAVMGAGPIGLTCGYFLGRSGYRVVVLAAEPQPGGALLGLSPQKLDPQILELEIERLVRFSNIEFRLGVPIDRNLLTDLQSGFDLIIVDPSELANISPAKDVALGFMKVEAGKNNIKVILPDLSEELKPFKYSLIAHYVAVGRRIAYEAHGYLAGQNRPIPAAQFISSAENAAPSLMSFDHAEIRLERFTADSSRPPKTLGKGRVMDGGQVLSEACRCLSCGTCNLCLQCISSCPDVSIHQSRTSTGVTFDLDHCKGCGICAHECPRGVISMEKVI